MEKPRLYALNKVPNCDQLVPNKLFAMGINPDIDVYICDLVACLFPERNNIIVEYRVNNTGVYDYDTTCITCLVDGGALFLTNINKETKKYKEFDDNCIVYVASVKRANVICCPTDKCLVGFGMTNTLDIRISDGDKVLQINGEYVFNEVESKVLTVPNKFGFEFFNQLLYNNKSLVAHEKIVEINGLYQLSEPDTTENEFNLALKQLSETPSFHTFSQRLFIPNALTTTTCDWIVKQMSSIRTEIQLLPVVSESVCNYMEFIIDNQLVVEICRFYNISLDFFAIDIISIMRRDKHGSDKRTSQFSMDIGFDDGAHSFLDGTKQLFRKGDCIVYLNQLRQTEENVVSKILTIEFNIRRKKMEMRMVF